MSTTFKTTIGTKNLLVNDAIKNFTIHDKASSMIAYIGINSADAELFIQFTNGQCFMYKEITPEVMTDIVTAPSVGKYFHASVKGKFPDELVGRDWIADAPKVTAPAEDYEIGVDPFDEDDEFFAEDLADDY